MNIDVSVIVLTYNSDYYRTIQTLSMILKQKKCKFEILIADDGSINNNYNEIEKFFKDKQFRAYYFIESSENIGTVKNCYRAVTKAKGKYVFCTSPGDLLHDEFVLYDFMTFAISQNAAVVTGDAIFYGNDRSNNMNNAYLKDVISMPYWPELFNIRDGVIKQAAFFNGNFMLGAAIIRERLVFEKYLSKIIDYIKYTEDNTTNAYMLMDHVKIRYYNRLFVFYEHGDGVSTQSSLKWHNILLKEKIDCLNMLSKEHPDSKTVIAAKDALIRINKPVYTRFFYSLFKYPLVTIVWLLMKIHYRKKTTLNSEELTKLYMALDC